MQDDYDLSHTCDRIVDVNRFALTTFHEVVKVAKKAELQAQGTEYQHVVEEFSYFIIESAGQALLAMSEGVVRRIAEEIVDHPVPSEEPTRLEDAARRMGIRILAAKGRGRVLGPLPEDEGEI